MHRGLVVRRRSLHRQWQTFASCGSLRRSTTARKAAFGDLYGSPIPEGHDATIIWLHGLGDTGRGWASVAAELQEIEGIKTARFLFPTAPTQPVTVNMGISMPSWFDINSLDPRLFQMDPMGLADSAKYIRGLVQEQVDAGIALNRIVLVGFSQGGAVALAACAEGLEEIGGVLMLSSFVGSSLPSGSCRLPPVKFFHGEADTLVPLWWAQQGFEALKAHGAQATFRSYTGLQHSSCREEMRDIADTLAATLGSS